MYTNNELTAVELSPTKKDFYQVWNELLEVAKKLSERWDPTSTNESDPGIVLLKVLTAVADKLSYNIDVNTLEAFMPSAAQESSMRNLCNMLGYNMKYFESAATTVRVTYHGSTFPKNNNDLIVIDRYSNIKDIDGIINYITLEPVILGPTKRSQNVECIEGELITCTTNAGSVITLDNLDSDFRYYLPESQVASNGIFITNVGYDSLWRKVDNLNTELIGQSVYKIGYDSRVGLPYVQFPTDVGNLINSGLVIRFVRTKGASGNISVNTLRTLEKPASWSSTAANSNAGASSNTITASQALAGDTSAESDSEWQDLSKYVITNINAATNGSNPETINQAYFNYQRSIGTFNTLVTCRDYMNKIYSFTKSSVNSTPLVSNIIVSDIRDDINRSYTLCKMSDQGVEYDSKSKVTTAENGDKIPLINYFDLMLYPFATTYLNTVSEYKHSFTYTDSSISDIIARLQDNKTIAHKFKSPTDDEIACVKVYYQLSARINTNTKVSTLEAATIEEALHNALYKNFNMRQVDFGEELPYDLILKVLEGADSRVKNVGLDDPVLYISVATVGGKEYPILKADHVCKDETTADKTAQYYIDLVLRNVLAGKINLLNYDNTFGTSYSESIYQADFPVEAYLESLVQKTEQGISDSISNLFTDDVNLNTVVNNATDTNYKWYGTLESLFGVNLPEPEDKANFTTDCFKFSKSITLPTFTEDEIDATPRPCRVVVTLCSKSDEELVGHINLTQSRENKVKLGLLASADQYTKKSPYGFEGEIRANLNFFLYTTLSEIDSDQVLVPMYKISLDLANIGNMGATKYYHLNLAELETLLEDTTSMSIQTKLLYQDSQDQEYWEESPELAFISRISVNNSEDPVNQHFALVINPEHMPSPVSKIICNISFDENITLNNDDGEAWRAWSTVLAKNVLVKFQKCMEDEMLELSSSNKKLLSKIADDCGRQEMKNYLNQELELQKAYNFPARLEPGIDGSYTTIESLPADGTIASLKDLKMIHSSELDDGYNTALPMVTKVTSEFIVNPELVSESKPLTLTENEIIQFRSPSFKTTMTYPAYVNYFAKLNDREGERDAIPATMYSLYDFFRGGSSNSNYPGYNKISNANGTKYYAWNYIRSLEEKFNSLPDSLRAKIDGYAACAVKVAPEGGTGVSQSAADQFDTEQSKLLNNALEKGGAIFYKAAGSEKYVFVTDKAGTFIKDFKDLPGYPNADPFTETPGNLNTADIDKYKVFETPDEDGKALRPKLSDEELSDLSKNAVTAKISELENIGAFYYLNITQDNFETFMNWLRARNQGDNAKNVTYHSDPAERSDGRVMKLDGYGKSLIADVYQKSGYNGSRKPGPLVDLGKCKYSVLTSLTYEAKANPLHTLYVPRLWYSTNALAGHTADGLGADAILKGIPANAEYRLASGEYIVLTYSTSEGRDDGSTVIKNVVLDSGTIVRSNFDIVDSKDLSKTVNYSKTSDFGPWKVFAGNSTEKWVGQTHAGADNIPGMFTLGATDQIEVREPIQVILDDPITKLYWEVKNKRIVGKYEYFPFTDGKYTLQAGEYLFYTNELEESMAYYGSGTEICVETRPGQTPIAIRREQSSDQLSAADISSIGLVRSIPWVTVNLSNTPLVLKEYQYINVTAGDKLLEVNVAAGSMLNSTFKTVVDSEAIYTVAGSDPISLPKIQIEGYSWEVASKLELNSSAKKPQVLNVHLAANGEEVARDFIFLHGIRTADAGSSSDTEAVTQVFTSLPLNGDTLQANQPRTNPAIYFSSDAVTAAGEFSLQKASDGTYKPLTVKVCKHENLKYADGNVLQLNQDLANMSKINLNYLGTNDEGETTDSLLTLNVLVPDDAFGLISIYYSPSKSTAASGTAEISNAAISLHKLAQSATSSGTQNIVPKILNYVPTEDDTQNIVQQSAWWRDSQGALFGDASSNEYFLRDGLNTIVISESCKLDLFYSPAAEDFTDKDLLFLSGLKIVKLSNSINPKLGFNSNAYPIKYKSTTSGTTSTRTISNNEIYKCIRALDPDNNFFYGVEIETTGGLDLSEADLGDTLAVPKNWLDTQNLNNKFVICEIDADHLVDHVVVSKFSRSK